MTYKFRPNFVALPVIAQCNYRCSFCEINGIDKKLKQQGKKYQRNVMTAENIGAFTSFLKTAAVVNLGGRTNVGEPLYAPTFDDVVRKIRSINRNIVIDLSTNGLLLTKERADFLLSNAPIAITFSMHAATPETYAAVMGPGNKDRFERVVENIRYFCSARVGKQTRVNVNFGIGKLNYHVAVDAVRLTKRLGADSMTVYLYYKSPNAFEEDVSLYNDVELANNTLQAVYNEAAKVGLQLDPQKPSFIEETRPNIAANVVSASDIISGKQSLAKTGTQPPVERYAGGCNEPFSSLVLKSDPSRGGKAAVAVCNRISPMIADLSLLKEEDISWAWHHPLFNQMRLPNPLSVPPICSMCKDPDTKWLRSLDQEGYKKKRDDAVRQTLAPFQNDALISSPNGAIKLLSQNIFSIDAAADDE